MLRDLDDEQLSSLAAEIRQLLISTCSARGGHLGPNLGVVELTLAMHRVFDSPRDRIVFDTGHQAYVHKMLTGRAGDFDRLRLEGGISGYPSQAESAHDIVENSHASTAISWADGLAKAAHLQGQDHHTVAVIGDGALTGGMAWEALNNIASTEGTAESRRLVIVVNDNGRSYTPTVGGLANHLTALRTSPRYEPMLDAVKRRLNGVPGVGPAVYDALHAMKKGMKDALAPQGLFEDLGLKYVGPVDGHDRAALEHALAQAKRFNGPVIVHAITEKGHGYEAAVRHEADQFHSLGPFDVETGKEAVRGLVVDRRLRRRAGRDRRGPPRGRGHHRRDAAPHRPAPLRRRASPTAPSTSASPSSTPPPPRPGWPPAGSTRSSPSTPPSSTGPSTRSSWTWPCTAAASPSCSTAPASPATTAPPTTACGTSRSSRSCRGCGSPPPATPPGCGSRCARRSWSTTPPPWSASPRARRTADLEAVERRGGVDVLLRAAASATC